MSKLQELINELCPNGVEFKKLGEVADIRTGKGITKTDATNGGEYPIISGGTSPMGTFHISNRKANTVTISRVGANAGYVDYIKSDFYLNDKCFSVIPTTIISDRINTKFLFYYLKSIELRIVEMQSEGGVPTINTQKVASIEIPVPPMAVQEEIVKILDRFTEYTAELQAELQARKEQYEYYRNLLLSFNPSASGYGTDDAQQIGVTTPPPSELQN
jgi:type I restriction enzyme S subunit